MAFELASAQPLIFFPMCSIGGSRTAATSKEELFVIIVNGFLDPPLLSLLSILQTPAYRLFHDRESFLMNFLLTIMPS